MNTGSTTDVVDNEILGLKSKREWLRAAWRLALVREDVCAALVRGATRHVSQKMSAEEKAAKKVAKEQEKAAKKGEKEAEAAAKKAEKAATKEAKEQANAEKPKKSKKTDKVV